MFFTGERGPKSDGGQRDGDAGKSRTLLRDGGG